MGGETFMKRLRGKDVYLLAVLRDSLGYYSKNFVL